MSQRRRGTPGTRIGAREAGGASFFFAFAIVALGCGGGDAPPGTPSPRSLSISGHVRDYLTQQPLEGALVVFEGSDKLVDLGRVGSRTDASGVYSLKLAPGGRYRLSIDGEIVGFGWVTQPVYRGDLFVHAGDCASRYGTIADRSTGRPVSGATVALRGRTTTTDLYGWYSLELGCDEDHGFNTTFIEVTHPRYRRGESVAGRGVYGVFRSDITLTPLAGEP